MRQSLLFISFLLIFYNSHSQNNIICENASSFCVEGSGFSSPNNINVQSGGQIACLGSIPNPSWHFIQIGNTGNVEMQISQINNSGNGIDVDFVLWGPFNSIESACSTLDFSYCQSCPNNTTNPNFYPFGNIVDCSFSSSNNENFAIGNAINGEVYILLLTNYSNQNGTITITQTNSNQSGSGNIIGDFEIDLGPDQNICDDTPLTTLDASSPYGDTYEWYRNGFLISGVTESTLVVTESGNYSVVAYNENCGTVAFDDILVSFVDCENAGLIHVYAFYDANGNSFYDTNENGFNKGYFTYEQNSDGIINNVSSSTGSFTIASFEDTNTYDFAYYVYDQYVDCYNITTATFETISVANGSEISIDFPLTDAQSCEDIAVHLISNSAPRPGFSYANYLSIENLGLVTTSGSIDFVLDANLTFNGVNTNPNYTFTTTATGFTLDFVNLQPGFSYNSMVSLSCPNSVALGELITNTATLTTTMSDTVTDNNSSSVTQTVVGSYDPNNIMEVHGPEIVYGAFSASNEYLYYLIQFQNLGTAEAIDVRIQDALDSQLDENTFQMLRSSHDYVVTRAENQLVWQFNDINLPSESMDADASQGFVYFKIKPQAGYGIGDMIPNVADIYFDFNAAITTNVFNTEFVETLSVNDFETSNFSMYPNPANNLVILQVSTAMDGLITVFDIQGKTILKKSFVNESSFQLDVTAFVSGLYFVKLNDGQHETIKKLIIN